MYCKLKLINRNVLWGNIEFDARLCEWRGDCCVWANSHEIFVTPIIILADEAVISIEYEFDMTPSKWFSEVINNFRFKNVNAFERWLL